MYEFCGATPELAVFSGNRCSECHIAHDGGGMRNEFGWIFGKDFSYLDRDFLSLGDLYDLADKDDYSYLDGLFAWGTDFRLSAIRSHKADDAKRRIIPMQAAFYINSQPIKQVTFEGAYNLGPKIFPGQVEWHASALIDISDEWPSLRIGYFQPAIGAKSCDMTSLDRRIAAMNGTETLIAPNYAEYGVELNYEGLDQLTVNAGVFDSWALSHLSLFGEKYSVVPVEHNPSFTARVIYWPDFAGEWFFFNMVGASAIVNGDFILTNIFARSAVTEEFLLSLEVAASNKKSLRSTMNFIGGVSYIPSPGLIFGVRAEHGTTTLTPGDDIEFDVEAGQIVFYANLILLPYLEIMPEYRYLSTEEYRSSRWALQLHLYY